MSLCVKIEFLTQVLLNYDKHCTVVTTKYLNNNIYSCHSPDALTGRALNAP